MHKFSGPGISVNSSCGFQPEKDKKKKTKNSRGLVKVERLKSSLSGNSEMLNQSLMEDWMVLGGNKTRCDYRENMSTRFSMVSLGKLFCIS